jgi:hypothetical protein
MTGSLLIAPRFCGPPGSANGGYACGLIAAHLDGQAEITLRQPLPLASPMAVEREGEGSVRVFDSDVLIAEGASSPGSPAVELPAPVTVRDARAAGLRSRLRVHPEEHPFPTCFVCGPARRPSDGLGIMPGPLVGRGLSPMPGLPTRRSRDRTAAWRPSSSGRRSTAPGRSGRSGTPPRMGRPTCWAGWRPASSARSGRASRMSWSAGAWPRTAASCSLARRCSRPPGRRSASPAPPGSASADSCSTDDVASARTC